MNTQAKTKLQAMDDAVAAHYASEDALHTASETADNLLMDAIRDVPGFTPPRVDDNPAEAILIAAHAIVAKLDAMETTLMDALRNSKAGL